MVSYPVYIELVLAGEMGINLAALIVKKMLIRDFGDLSIVRICRTVTSMLPTADVKAPLQKN